MKNNFIQMAASAGHVIAYTIGPIFKHCFIDCVQLYFTNGLFVHVQMIEMFTQQYSDDICSMWDD